MKIRRLRLEPLESRRLLAAVNLDVNRDGQISPADALAVINRLSEHNPAVPSVRFDVDGSGHTSAIDALMVINYLGTETNELVPPTNPVVPAKHVVSYTIAPDFDIWGMSDAEESAIFAGMERMFEEVGDVEFRQVSSGGRLHFYSGELYLGNGVHAGGLQTGNRIGLHNNRYGPYRHSGTRGPVDEWLHWRRFSVASTIKVLAHETYGALIDHDHSHDERCIMHPHARGLPDGWWCGEEIRAIQRRFD